MLYGVCVRDARIDPFVSFFNVKKPFFLDFPTNVFIRKELLLLRKLDCLKSS